MNTYLGGMFDHAVSWDADSGVCTITVWGPLQQGYPTRLNGLVRKCLTERPRAVLLDLHGKAHRWFHFGGHWEPGDDSLLATATREASEESGIVGLRIHPQPVHLDVHEVEFCRGHDRAGHFDVRYAAVAPAGVDARASDESLAVRWWPLAGLPDLEPEMHDLIRLARARLQVSPPASLAPAE